VALEERLVGEEAAQDVLRRLQAVDADDDPLARAPDELVGTSMLIG
jgi:hypothetical protein